MSSPIKFPLLALAVLAFGTHLAHASTEPLEPRSPEGGWHHSGMTGTFDRAALQRGFQVYKEVCAACHSLKYIAYRNLQDIGFSEDEVKALAAQAEVTDGPNEQGEMFKRPGRPSDRFVPPFPNEQAARFANNGALPPDLSLMVKARHGGENYVFSVLTGFAEPPADLKMNAGMNFNPYFPGRQIAMPPPLSEGAVTYADGTKATVEQMAKDVTTFLAWAAEPKLEARKYTGIKAMIFLLVFAFVMYLAKKRVWRDVH